MMTIDNYKFAGKKAIVRVDFNVPLDENGKITDDTRIRGALPTLKKILGDGGALIIMSHMGKPKGKVNPKFSLSQIVDAVSEKLGVPVKFAPDCAKAGDAAAALKPGEVLLLENLRFYPEEEGKPVGIDKEDPAYEAAKKAMKESQKEFAKTLASYADCYVNDAFGTAHRKHASTAVIADYFDADNKMLGYLMEKEVQAVDNVLSNIKRPFTAIMGGSKVSTKIGIIENLMDKVDNLILCGGMTYTFAKAQGGKIGNSICEDDKLDLALDIIAKAKAKGVNLVLGTDCVAADAFSNDANTQIVPANNIRTAPPACLSSTTSQPVRAPSPKPLPKLRRTAHSPSSVAATPWLASTSSAWPTKCLTSPPAAAPCSKPSKGKSCRVLQPSRVNPLLDT